MKLSNRFKKSPVELFSCAFFAVLLATLVFAMEMTDPRIASAATSTHKVTDVTGTVTQVELTNVDLQVYEKYNADIQSISKNLLPISSLTWNENSTPGDKEKDIYNKRALRFLAKASPGSTISIRIQPESKLDGYYITRLLLASPYRIEGNRFDLLAQGVGAFLYQYPKKIETKSYTIRQNEDFIYVCWCHDYSDANTIVRGQVYHKDAIKTEYYIFTSDEAFQKAYKIWTGKTITAPIGSSSSESDLWEMVSMIGIGLCGGGVIIVILKWLFGKKGVGTTPHDADPQYPQYPQEQDSFVYTDPSTGAQTLYQRDPNTGEWFNPSTNSIVDMNDLDRFEKQRMADKAWTNDQMKNLSDRNTAVDKAWRNQDQQAAQEMQKTFDAIDRQGAKDRAAIKSGTYGMSEERRKEVQRNWQSVHEMNQKAANRVANTLDMATKTLEVTEKAADIAIDGLSVITAPAGGKLIADVYAGVKNVGKSTVEAAVNGKSILGGMAKGAAKGAADIFQNNAGGSWKAKLGTFLGTETGKELIVATIDGEDKVKAIKKGFSNGLFKYAVSEIGDNISAGVGQQNSNAMKQHYKEINRVWINNKDLSQKSINKLTSMNFQKYFGKETTRELTQGFGQAITKEAGATAYDVGMEGKSVSESLFDDKW